MASSMISSAAVATTRSSPTQANMVASFTGLKSATAFPVTKKSADITSLASNGGRIQCMQAGTDLVKAPEQLAKEIDYLLRSRWIPCLEFELEHRFVTVKTQGHQDTMTGDIGLCGS
ncbi:hypothetical protein M9H77_05509 [Catharanthus roseus]|uniref:Uncharacterized protein n=1 Tax=Catharanthus roseus TaxID=4058 RepID=A0ACC0CHR2_CATRO|nr:hypothetical protein M9H77_05509 [Catharanthus roseus]